MNLVSIVGARPQFIKIAPVCRAIETHNRSGMLRVNDFILNTGQHYDPEMSDVFFSDLEIPAADLDLAIGSGSHAIQTAGMLAGIEAVLQERDPDVVVIYGDTNSTLAGALAASKLGIRIAHVESGLRSDDRSMPEEINRIVADHLADLLLAPTSTAVENLRREGLAERTRHTGDVMLDALLQNMELARGRGQALKHGLEVRAYAVATVHRAENTVPENLGRLLEAFNRIAAACLPVVFPVHPRTRAQLDQKFADFVPHPNLRLVEPIGYLDMLNLLDDARLTLTDSGGLQKEAFFLGTPCVTLRDRTEWSETVDAGANIVAGSDIDAIGRAVAEWMARTDNGQPDFSPGIADSFGDGHAAERVIEALRELVGNNDTVEGRVACQ